MSEKKKAPLPRNEAVAMLIHKFTKDYNEIIQEFQPEQQIELCQHLLSVFELMEKYTSTNDLQFHEEFVLREEALLKRFGKTLLPYSNKQFHTYFAFEFVLVDKDLYTLEEYKQLPDQQQTLSTEEISYFFRQGKAVLFNARKYIYLRSEPAFTSPSISAGTEAIGPEQDKDITKARQLLAIYYLLKAGFDIEHRSSHAVSKIAKLIHLLTGTKLSSLQNSDIYKKYKEIPDYNKGEQLIADLKFIRPYFEEPGFEKILPMIDAKIEDTIRKLPFTLKDKYTRKKE